MKNEEARQFIARLAATIHTERKKRGLSHERLAEKAGVTRQAISNIESESGNPTVLTLLKVAKAFDLELSELFALAEAGQAS